MILIKKNLLFVATFIISVHLKTVVKTDGNSSKRRHHYLFRKDYRIGNSVRHQSIVSMGKPEGIDNKENKKLLANRAEAMLKEKALLHLCKPHPEHHHNFIQFSIH
jgi:hypothetical protein